MILKRTLTFPASAFLILSLAVNGLYSDLMDRKTSQSGTEAFDSRYKGIETWPDERILSAILDAQEAGIKAVRPVLPLIAGAAEESAARLRSGEGRLVYAGAGTPARLGYQDGAELFPTFGWPLARLAFVIAGGEKALLQAVEGAEDNEQAAREDVDRLSVGPADVLIAVSASGRTPFTVAACERARLRGAYTIGIASNANTPLLAAAECPLFIDSGAEPVAGSTRMSAGTVQKAALNLLSTLIMIRLGHVYDGMMVDVQLTNAKLKARAVRMLREITGCDETAAVDALAQADGHVKLAVLVLKGLSAGQGKELLRQQGQDLRAALESL